MPIVFLILGLQECSRSHPGMNVCVYRGTTSLRNLILAYKVLRHLTFNVTQFLPSLLVDMRLEATAKEPPRPRASRSQGKYEADNTKTLAPDDAEVILLEATFTLGNFVLGVAVLVANAKPSGSSSSPSAPDVST